MKKRFILDEIEAILDFFPVLGIVGPRQVGKTTLAKYLMPRLKKECVYLDLELPEDLSKLTEMGMYFEKHRNKCIIIDEIQRKPELFPVLRAEVDKKRIPARFIVLGSASPELIRDASESLAGRIAYKELAPFNLIELGEAEIEAHWFKGGFPDSFLAKGKISNIWLNNFIRTYIERDLPMLGLITSAELIRRLWVMLAYNHGNLLNTENFARALGVSSPTIKKYIRFLEEAFLLYSLRPFYFNIKKRLVKSPKVYIRDSGVLHNLLQIKTSEKLFNNIAIGASWEGYVIEQIRQLLIEDFEFYFYRTHQGAECDLVLAKSGIPEISIEIKYSNAPKITKGFITSINDLGTKQNYIITPSSETYRIKDNIVVINLWDFLTNQIEKPSI